MQTASMEAQARSRLTNAISRLLHNLRPWMRAYPEHQGDTMPEHRLVWVTGPDGGPEQTIGEAIKEHPELWAHALPEECCIVSREVLARYVGRDIAEFMAAQGAHLVEEEAARARYAAEESKRKK